MRPGENTALTRSPLALRNIRAPPLPVLLVVPVLPQPLLLLGHALLLVDDDHGGRAIVRTKGSMSETMVVRAKGSGRESIIGIWERVGRCAPSGGRVGLLVE